MATMRARRVGRGEALCWHVAGGWLGDLDGSGVMMTIVVLHGLPGFRIT